jgi:hypothetical protein
MRRIAVTAGLQEEVMALAASRQWVDLYRVFTTQLLTGTPGTGSKTWPRYADTPGRPTTPATGNP